MSKTWLILVTISVIIISIQTVKAEEEIVGKIVWSELIFDFGYLTKIHISETFYLKYYKGNEPVSITPFGGMVQSYNASLSPQSPNIFNLVCRNSLGIETKQNYTRVDDFNLITILYPPTNITFNEIIENCEYDVTKDKEGGFKTAHKNIIVFPIEGISTRNIFTIILPFNARPWNKWDKYKNSPTREYEENNRIYLEWKEFRESKGTLKISFGTDSEESMYLSYVSNLLNLFMTLLVLIIPVYISLNDVLKIKFIEWKMWFVYIFISIILGLIFITIHIEIDNPLTDIIKKIFMRPQFFPLPDIFLEELAIGILQRFIVTTLLIFSFIKIFFSFKGFPKKEKKEETFTKKCQNNRSNNLSF